MSELIIMWLIILPMAFYVGIKILIDSGYIFKIKKWLDDKIKSDEEKIRELDKKIEEFRNE